MFTLFDADITTAITGVIGPGLDIGGLAPYSAEYLAVIANFAYGSGGTTCKVWIQTSIDPIGWTDIMSFAFTTSAAKKVSAVHKYTALAAAQALQDAALADNTILNGLLGKFIRAKVTTTGTYTGVTHLNVVCNTR